MRLTPDEREELIEHLVDQFSAKVKNGKLTPMKAVWRQLHAEHRPGKDKKERRKKLQQEREKLLKLKCSECLARRKYIIETWEGLTLKDPVHGLIHFEPDEAILIDTCYVQRLREIKQTGFLSYLFPAATHTRFEHSLGVAYLAKKMFDSLDRKCDLDAFFNWLLRQRGIEPTPELIEALKFIERKVVTYAAILHDIGHGPFSHASEVLYKMLSVFTETSENFIVDDHLLGLYENKKKRRSGYIEQWNKPHEVEGCIVICRPHLRVEGLRRTNCLYTTLRKLFKFWLDELEVPNEVRTRLHIHDHMLVKKVGIYLLKDDPAVLAAAFSSLGMVNVNVEEFRQETPLHQLINGDWIDADKLDYLIRDAYFAGFNLSKGFDIDFVINNLRLCFDPSAGRFVLVINDRALPDLIALMLGKYFMSMAIHAHPVNVIAQDMFNLAILRWINDFLKRIRKEGARESFLKGLTYRTIRNSKDREFIKRIGAPREAMALLEMLHNRQLFKLVAVYELRTCEDLPLPHILSARIARAVVQWGILNENDILVSVEKLKIPDLTKIRVVHVKKTAEGNLIREVQSYQDYLSIAYVLELKRPPAKILRIYVALRPMTFIRLYQQDRLPELVKQIEDVMEYVLNRRVTLVYVPRSVYPNGG